MMRSRLPIFAAVAALPLAAQAADLPPYESSPYFGPASVSMMEWSGVYLGVQGGYGFGDYAANGTDFDADGFLVGGTVGANRQFDRFVVGAEGDLSFSGIEGSRGTPSIEADTDWLATVRGRVGVAFDSFLLFGTGGIAFGGIDVETPAGRDSETHVGWTVGGGIEYALTDRLSAKGDYLYVDLGKQTHNLGGTAVDADYSGHLFRVGFNYKLW